MIGLGPLEMAVVGVIAVLLFGKRLPEVGQSLGRGIAEFKQGNANFTPRSSQQFDDELRFFLGLLFMAVIGFFALLMCIKLLTSF